MATGERLEHKLRRRVCDSSHKARLIKLPPEQPKPGAQHQTTRFACDVGQSLVEFASNLVEPKPTLADLGQNNSHNLLEVGGTQM